MKNSCFLNLKLKDQIYFYHLGDATSQRYVIWEVIEVNEGSHTVGFSVRCRTLSIGDRADTSHTTTIRSIEGFSVKKIIKNKKCTDLY